MFFNDGTHCPIEELDSVIMTQNGPYTYRDWQDDMHTYREQKWDIKVAQHKAEYYAGLHSMSYKVIIGTLAVPGVIIGSAEFAAAGGVNWLVQKSGSLISTKFWGGKAIISGGTQAIINNGNVDVADVGLDAILTPGVAPFARTVFDVRPKTKQYAILGVNSEKSLMSATIETGAGYIGYALGARITPSIGYIESNTMQNMARLMITKNYSLVGRGVNKGLQEHYSNNKK
ncbi:hypothetical protein [uncultured Maribacter sp.]|uniref:hypothetical protein n=1 Tax=uncultured Maribacter sp. TaxID=431308 RepID=UPI00261DDA1E|nr:hypothetical protein [uncultured Maribacter sp.]